MNLRYHLISHVIRPLRHIQDKNKLFKSSLNAMTTGLPESTGIRFNKDIQIGTKINITETRSSNSTEEKR